MTRARRRADEKAHQAKRIKLRKDTMLNSAYVDRHWIDKNKRYQGILKNHSTTCSCEMCGNPRHSKWSKKKSKLTLQERKQLEREATDTEARDNGDESILQ